MTARYVGPPMSVSCPGCGFAGEYRTPGIARKALEKHSCEHRIELAARARRVIERRTSEGEKRDCFCKEAEHAHGTRLAYVIDKCRCRPCTDASAIYNANLRKQQVFGRYDSGKVDSAPVRAHARMLMTEGVSARQIAKLTGLSSSTIGALIYGRTERGHAPYPRIRCENAAKIMAIKPKLTNVAARHCIDATGTKRRLQALVAIGWSQSRLAGRLGLRPSNFGTLLRSGKCTAKRALEVMDLYDELWNQPQFGTDWHSKSAAARARNYAAALGWAPPLAWDDDVIDDPNASPDRGAKVYAQGQTPVGAVRKSDADAEDVEFLVNEGMTWDGIIARLNMNPVSLDRSLRRQGRGDLIRRAKTMTERLAYARAS